MMSSGQMTTGAVLSVIVTANEQVAWLLLESVAVQVTVWLPTAKTVPAGFTGLPPSSSQATVTAPQRSLASTSKLTVAPPLPSLHSFSMFSGHTSKTGGVVSSTVTLNVQELVLPVASWAVAVTDVVPGNRR